MELRVKGLLVSHASTPQYWQQWVAAVAGVYCQINTQQGASKTFLLIAHPHRLPMCLHLSYTKCQDRCLPVIIPKSALQASDTNSYYKRLSFQFYTENGSQSLYYGNLTRPFITSLFRPHS